MPDTTTTTHPQLSPRDRRLMLSRYKQLIERARFELRQAGHLAVALGLPANRQARVSRARLELYHEAQEGKRR